MMDNTNTEKAPNIRVLDEMELSSVSAGAAPFVAVLAVVGAYSAGKEIGRGIRWAYRQLTS